jgi:hypothetical protein
MSMPLGDPVRHFFLTRSVARVMGLNLSEAIQRGVLAPEDYAEMVADCSACALVSACRNSTALGDLRRRS